MEKLLLSTSLKLTGIPSEKIPEAIDDALIRIGEFLGADRAYIFELNRQNITWNNTYEWCNTDIIAQIQNLQGIPVDLSPMF